MKGFRIRSKKFFLTYPHCNLNLEDVLFQIQEKVKEKNIFSFNFYVLSKEKHALNQEFNFDSRGNFHLKEELGNNSSMDRKAVENSSDSMHIHVFFEVESTLDIGNFRFFDLQDPKYPIKYYHGH